MTSPVSISITLLVFLDIIKEGVIPNVNEYTFGVYKSFPDIGSNYYTAIAFMAQNGVRRIVKNNAKNLSIFTDDTSNPIDTTIRDIAKELGLTVDNWTPISQVISKINTQYI